MTGTEPGAEIDATGHGDHTDPYCATHCVPGVKHSQCGCFRSHRVTPPGSDLS